MDLGELIKQFNEYQRLRQIGQISVERCIALCQPICFQYLKASTKSSKIYWMTINFKPDVSLDTVMSVLNKLGNRSFMSSYWYNIEQRSDTIESIHGIHSHWLVKTSHPFAQFKRDVFNTVKSFVGNQRHVDVKVYPESFFEEKLDYLKGTKWDIEKDPKVLVDNLWRKQNNLEIIYTNEIRQTSSSTLSEGKVL